LLGQFQQPSLHSDDLLFLGHIIISVPPEGGPRSQLWGENRDPPSGSASETNNDCQSKFELIHRCPAPLDYLRAYDSVAEARASIGRYLNFYNGKRPHSSLDARTPDHAYFERLPQVAAA
jgi:hypothetical protein